MSSLSIGRVLRSIFNGDGKPAAWALPLRVVESISAGTDQTDSFQLACEEIRRGLDARRTILILNREGGPRIVASSDSQPGTAGSGPVDNTDLRRNELACCLSSLSAIEEIADLNEDPRRETVADLIPGDGLRTVKAVLISPLIENERTIGGILVFGSGNRGRWRPEEKLLLQAACSSLAMAIHQGDLYEKEKSAANREAITNRLLTALRTAAGVDEIFRVAVEGTGSVLGVTRAAIYLYAEREAAQHAVEIGPAMTIRAEYVPEQTARSFPGSSLDIGSSLLMGRLLAGEILSIADTSEGDPYVRSFGMRLGVRAMVLAPIDYKERIAAVLALEQHDRPRRFTEEELGLVRTVTEQAAVALHQAELYREAQEAARRDALIGKITSAMHSSLDQDIVLQTIVDELGKALAVCRCQLTLVPDPMPEALAITHEYVAACCSGKQARAGVGGVRDNIHLQALLSVKIPLAVDDVWSDERMASYRQEYQSGGVKSILAAAIWLRGHPIGVFSLQHSEGQHSWTRWEIDLVQSVAEQAAVAIRQAELYREARESATRAALVNEIVGSIRRSLDLEEILRVAVQELGYALDASRVIFRKVEDRQIVVVAEYLKNETESLMGAPEDTANYQAQQMVETSRTFILDDVGAFVNAHPALGMTVRAWQGPARSRSEIVCPILVNNEFWGALSIDQTDRVRRWTASEIALVEAVTAQIEVAVSHSRLFEEARLAARREALISRIIHGINQSNRLDEIMPLVVKELGDYIASDSLSIVKHTPDADIWEIEWEYKGGQISRRNRTYQGEEFGNIASHIKSGPLVSNDVEADASMAPFLERHLRPAGTRSILAVPLNYRQGPGFVLVAVMSSGPRAWTQEEIEVLQAAADQLLIAVERAELFEQVSRGKHEWEATFDALTDGIFIFDRTGKLSRVNQVGAALEHKSVEQLIGRRCCSIMQGIEGENCRVAPVIETGRPVTFEMIPEHMQQALLVTISPLTSEGPTSDGSAPGAVCVVRDLSELRAAEAAAREQRGFLVKLIEHANDAIFAVSPEGKFIWFNEQLSKLSGYTRDELFVSEFNRFIPEGDGKIAVEWFTRALGGEPQTFEMRGIKKSGEVRLLQVTYTPIYDKGRVSSVLSIARDITEERVAAERAAQADKLRALGQLASGVAHNFNNILAAILGHAQLAKRDSPDDRLLRRIDVIERAALDGAQTVKRIQGFAIQQNEDVFEPIDVNQLLQDSANLTRARWADDAQASGLPYEVELKLRPLPVTRGSASELREVFVNIILNALDAMPQGGCLLISSEARNSHINVKFTDSGVGMSRPVRQRIFEPFFTTKGTKGMGLGLAVSYSIVERHGGRIEVTSSPGHGSIFSIVLPVAEARVEVPADSIRRLNNAVNVLVVDDDQLVREAIVGMLSATGHQAEQAASGREALALLESGKYNLVVTDLAMPEMDGWATASEIKRRWPDTKVVLATGFAVSSELVESRGDLVDAVIYKPIRLNDITAALNRVLGQ